jgi:hypothetical protein
MTTLPNPGGSNLSIGNDDGGARTAPYTDTAFSRGVRVDETRHDSVTARTERQWNEWDDAPKRDGVILSTARTATGAPETGPIKPDTVVTVNGVAMRAIQAANLGFLKIDEATNTVAEVTPEEYAAKEQAKLDEAKQAEIASRVLPDAGSMAAVDSLRNALEAHNIDAQAALAELWVSPEGQLPKSFELLARGTGTPPHVLQAQLHSVIEAWGEALDDQLIRPAGINLDEFWAWAKEQFTRFDHARASMRLAQRGDASVYKTWLDKFVSTKGMGKGGRSGEKYGRPLPAGVTHRVDSQGRTLIKVTLQSGRQIEMTYANARNQGFI